MKAKIYVTKAISGKTGKEYFKLCADLGYIVKVINLDAQLCAELLGISVRELYETVKVGEKYEI